jgi:uncharacterized protein (TIGR03067 family)
MLTAIEFDFLPRRNSMKRLLALFLALGLMATAVPATVAAYQDKDKKEEKKDTPPKDAKPKDDKPKEDPKLTDAQKKDLSALSGTFVIISYERDGKKAPADEIKTMKVVQEGAEWKFYQGDDITLGRDTVYPDKSPKQVDSYYINGPVRDKVAKGLYKIDGDTVTYVHADPGKERPTEFATKPDSGLTLIVLKKMPAAPKDGDKKDGKDKKDK